MKEKKDVEKIVTTDNAKPENTSRRDFVKRASTGTAGILAAATAPYAYSATNPIKWRLQTYSGAPLGAHVIKPQIESFNRAAHGQMEIELYYADQLVPTDELFRAMQNGTIDAVQVMMRRWHLLSTLVFSVVIFHSQPDTVSIYLFCLNTTV